MALIHVQDFPEETYNQLVMLSKEQGISVEEEALVLLKHAVNQTTQRAQIMRQISEALFDNPEAYHEHLHSHF